MSIADRVGLIGLVALALPSIADATQAPTEAAPRWVVDHGAAFCSLLRNDRSAGTMFAIRTIPGSESYELILSDARWQSLPIDNGQTVDLVLSPVGKNVAQRVLTGRLANGHRSIGFAHLSPGFLEDFAQATRLEVKREGNTVFAVDFPRAGRATQALHSCVDQTLLDWGIDPVARARLRSLPLIMRVSITATDQPLQGDNILALGNVVVRLTISAAGRVMQCALVQSSGEPLLDRRTCENWRRFGQFQPAIGADGRPTQADIITRVRWGG